MSFEQKTFKKYGSTYYWGSKFFPKPLRDDAYKLYSFVQLVDDYTDSDQTDAKAFAYIERRWKLIKKQLLKGTVPAKLDDSVNEYALANIAYIVHRYQCDEAWVDAFLHSKRWDLEGHEYTSFKETLLYMYGSSEVVGLIIARILNFPEEALTAARMQARAMQMIDFLRTIQYNTMRGRSYFPTNEIKMHGLKQLSFTEAQAKPNMFTDFVQSQLLRYADWQTQANKGYYYVPKKLRPSIQATIDTYNATAKQIKDDPMVVFKKQLKPKKRRIILRAVKYSVKKPT